MRTDKITYTDPDRKTYDYILTVCSKVSVLLDNEQLEVLMGWLTREAAQSPADDQLALQLMRRVVEVYQNDL